MSELSSPIIFDSKKSILTKGLNNKINLLNLIKIIPKIFLSSAMNEFAARKYNTKVPINSPSTAEYSHTCFSGYT